MNDRWAYLNGEWIADSALKISVEDVGFLVGATVTERLRTFRGAVFRLDEHIERLRRSLAIVGLDGERICRAVRTAISEFIARNQAELPENDDWSIVAFVTPGISGSGTETVCVHGYPLPFGQWADKYDRGVDVVISDVRQVPANCWPPELKCRSRMHFYLADRQAALKSPGSRAILLDQDGHLAEATTANLILFRPDLGLCSPPEENILPGVSLGVAEELAGQLGIPFRRIRLTRDDVLRAEEFMLCSTSLCLQAIVTCDGEAIGSGLPGPVYLRLLSSWSEMVGVNIVEQAKAYRTRGSH